MLHFFKREKTVSSNVSADFHPAIQGAQPVAAWVVLNVVLAGVTRRLPLSVSDAGHLAGALETGQEASFFLAQTPNQQAEQTRPPTLFVEGMGLHACLQVPDMDIPVQAVDGLMVARALREALAQRLN